MLDRGRGWSKYFMFLLILLRAVRFGETLVEAFLLQWNPALRAPCYDLLLPPLLFGRLAKRSYIFLYKTNLIDDHINVVHLLVKRDLVYFGL